MQPEANPTETALPRNAAPPSGANGDHSPQLLRYLQAAGIVALWMLLGFGLRQTGLSADDVANGYLLLGIPLLLLFQKFVRRKTIATVWVRAAKRLDMRVGAVRLIGAVALAAVPLYQLVVAARAGTLSLIGALWLVAAMAGAFAAAYTLQHTSTEALRKGLPGFLAAVALGCSLMATSALIAGRSPLPTFEGLWGGLMFFLLYFAVSFMIEEVFFRGMLDSHVQPLPATTGTGWLSAVYVSLLWGLWHVPLTEIFDPLGAVLTVIAFSVVHVLIGVPLSICWRSSGSLLLPAAAHALIDAYRNVVVM